MQRKQPDCSTLEQTFCFPFKIIEKSVIFIQSWVSILVLTLPFHNFLLHSSSKIPLLSFSDFISEHVVLSLISFLCLHCFTNFLLAYSLCVSYYQFQFSLSYDHDFFFFPCSPFPHQESLCSAKLLMAGKLWQVTDPPVFSCVCPWIFLTGHLWKQGSGIPELLVWSIKAVSVISSIWLWLVRAVNKRDLLSATLQTEGSASALHWPLLFWLSKWRGGRSFSFWACHRAVSRDFIGNCPFACMLLVFFSKKLCSSIALKHLPPGQELVSRPPGTQNHFCDFCPHQPFPTWKL